MGWGIGTRRPARRVADVEGGADAPRSEGSGGPGRDDPAVASRKPARPGLSLKGRALKLLSQREQSRLELTRKLAPHAESAEQVEAVLDELERSGFLSSRRFAESLAHRRAPRFGLRRIEHEFDAHRLDAAVAAPVLQGLRDTERERALQAWRKRFGEPAADAAGRSKQHRFLAQRGFTGDAIHWVLRQGGDRSADPSDDTPFEASDGPL
ncbi:MAG: recombination regulator RecX [Burkholderiales bacterium]|nr:MAG: recombination regulator RecX [Burkholderiales bacterium]